jgi:hypothetical protein
LQQNTPKSASSFNPNKLAVNDTDLKRFTELVRIMERSDRLSNSPSQPHSHAQPTSPDKGTTPNLGVAGGVPNHPSSVVIKQGRSASSGAFGLDTLKESLPLGNGGLMTMEKIGGMDAGMSKTMKVAVRLVQYVLMSITWKMKMV